MGRARSVGIFGQQNTRKQGEKTMLIDTKMPLTLWRAKEAPIKIYRQCKYYRPTRIPNILHFSRDFLKV